MGQLNVRLTDDQMEALKRYAARHRMPVSSLIKNYVDHLLKGGQPVAAESDTEDEFSAAALSALAERGGSFDWLADEPDLYTARDGETI